MRTGPPAKSPGGPACAFLHRRRPLTEAARKVRDSLTGPAGLFFPGRSIFLPPPLVIFFGCSAFYSLTRLCAGFIYIPCL
ncbi:MAG: hypothetical protein A3F83_14105 [Candidatus Glassbacteria bacterium RIFCSPLOWO2_12_FULL_58_11]|uniref:Uncharacterized protein n=1 Tax=Candidatus Glassbacteria bacterium RIFCSPLOWO2_12_FULL_58_11 TaxID=1817867 RepID=A0A1F5Z4D1_9BACT|nr:MAG: hypothetical protein A3F83_14105 [Candidatus Glassbacteria bacterium RIFCSPLOWO2_12_FULL_58_11]